MSFKKDRDNSQNPFVVSTGISLSSPQGHFLMERMAVRTTSGLLSKGCRLFWATRALCPGNPSEPHSLEPQLSYLWPLKEIPDHFEAVSLLHMKCRLLMFETLHKFMRELGFTVTSMRKLPAWQQASKIESGPHHSADFREEIANAQTGQKCTQTESGQKASYL